MSLAAKFWAKSSFLLNKLVTRKSDRIVTPVNATEGVRASSSFSLKDIVPQSFTTLLDDKGSFHNLIITSFNAKDGTKLGVHEVEFGAHSYAKVCADSEVALQTKECLGLTSLSDGGVFEYDPDNGVEGVIGNIWVENKDEVLKQIFDLAQRMDPTFAEQVTESFDLDLRYCRIIVHTDGSVDATCDFNATCVFKFKHF